MVRWPAVRLSAYWRYDAAGGDQRQPEALKSAVRAPPCRKATDFEVPKATHIPGTANPETYWYYRREPHAASLVTDHASQQRSANSTQYRRPFAQNVMPRLQSSVTRHCVPGKRYGLTTHDIVMTADGVLYVCENDNPYRSSYLWEIKVE